MADKYIGAIVGSRERGSDADGMDLDDAAASASVAELLLTADGTLLQAVLRVDGGLQWRPVGDAELAVARQAAQSQMASMLMDGARNTAYATAIAKCIAEVRGRLGRPPRVLDIGAGTGLLSMLAAVSGARSVVGAEQGATMAALARACVSANAARLPAPVRIVPARSDASEMRALLTEPVDASDARAGSWLPADVCVSEILDSALLGEAVLPSLRHAVQTGLVLPEPDIADRVCVPRRAIVHAQLVHHPRVCAWMHSTHTHMPAPGGDIRLTRKDWDEGAEVAPCIMCPKAIPVHTAALQDELQAVSDPFDIAEVHFDARSLAGADERIQNVYRQSVTVRADAPAVANALIFWWTAVLWEPPSTSAPSAAAAASATGRDGCGVNVPNFAPIPPDAVTYCTSSEAVKRQGFQDHWTQCVWPLRTDVPVQRGGVVSVVAEVTDLDIAFHVRAQPAEAVSVWPSKRDLNQAARSGVAAAVAARERLLADSSLPEAQQSLVFLERETCSCGLHAVCNPERVWMLNTPEYVHGVSAACANTAAILAEREVDDTVAVFSLGDVHMLPLALERHRRFRQARLVAAGLAHSLPARTFSECLAAQAGWRVLDMDDDEDEDEIDEDVEDTADMEVSSDTLPGRVPTLSLLTTAPMDAVPMEGLLRFLAKSGASAFSALLAEPYLPALHDQPLWTLASIWNTFSFLGNMGAVMPGAVVQPAGACVCAQAIWMHHANVMHGQVGTVQGFDHAPFDVVEAHWQRGVYSYPMWQYAHTALSEPQRVCVCDLTHASPFALDAFTPDAPAEIIASTQLHVRPPPDIPGRAAVMVWVDYDLLGDGCVCVRTHPQHAPFSRQLVVFMEPTARPASAGDVTVEVLIVMEDGRPSVRLQG